MDITAGLKLCSTKTKFDNLFKMNRKVAQDSWARFATYWGILSFKLKSCMQITTAVVGSHSTKTLLNTFAHLRRDPCANFATFCSTIALLKHLLWIFKRAWHKLFHVAAHFSPDLELQSTLFSAASNHVLQRELLPGWDPHHHHLPALRRLHHARHRRLQLRPRCRGSVVYCSHCSVV